MSQPWVVAPEIDSIEQISGADILKQIVDQVNAEKDITDLPNGEIELYHEPKISIIGIDNNASDIKELPNNNPQEMAEIESSTSDILYDWQEYSITDADSDLLKSNTDTQFAELQSNNESLNQENKFSDTARSGMLKYVNDNSVFSTQKSKPNLKNTVKQEIKKVEENIDQTDVDEQDDVLVNYLAYILEMFDEKPEELKPEEVKTLESASKKQVKQALAQRQKVKNKEFFELDQDEEQVIPEAKEEILNEKEDDEYEDPKTYLESLGINFLGDSFDSQIDDEQTSNLLLLIINNAQEKIREIFKETGSISIAIDEAYKFAEENLKVNNINLPSNFAYAISYNGEIYPIIKGSS